MFLIVGLGNPGAQYARTRHNIGWLVLDELSRRWSIELSRTNCEAKVGGGLIGEQRVTLAKPQTFMNLSGRSVAALMRYQNVPQGRIIIITDDLNLPVGKLRLRANGSHGGHNGLKSIAQHLGGNEYARLRFGVGEPPQNEREVHGTKDFVLRPFMPDEMPDVEAAIARAADCIETWLREGVEIAMNRFNAEPSASKPAREKLIGGPKENA
jgi:PTH1 family peptidyl-tRNA hydrolase